MADRTVTETVIVEMSDTDMSRFIHFASVVEFFEVGLRGILEAAGLTFRDLFDQRIGLPIVRTSCDYHEPIFYADRLTVESAISDRSEKTVTLDVELSKADEAAASGTLTFCFFDIDAQEAVPMPPNVESAFVEAGLLA